MNLLFFLKTLAEFAFYFAFGNYFAVTGGGSPIPFYVAFLPIISLFLCYLWREKPQKMRILPLFLMLFGILFLRDASSVLVFAVSAVYCSTLVVRRNFYQSYESAVVNFKRCTVFLLILPVLTMVVGGLSVLGDNCAPYVLVFLCASILQTRMLRHDARTLESRGFQIQNLIAVALVLLLGLLSTTPVVMAAISAALKFVYFNAIIPMIRLLMYGVMGIIWVIVKVLSFIFPKFKAIFPPGEDFDIIIGLGEDLEYAEATGTPEFVQWIFAAIGIALLIWAAVYILKKLTERRNQNNEKAEFYDKREQLERREPPHKREFFAPRDPRAAVRHYYAKYLGECRKIGVPVRGAKTATDIAEAASDSFDKKAVGDLTQLYIIARYSSRNIEKSDAKSAKIAYNIIKSAKAEETNDE